MKKTLLILVLLFIAVKTNAQSLDKIKKQNVFFILLDHKDNLSSYGCSKGAPLDYCSYHFLKANKKVFEFNFIYSDYNHIDHKRNNINKTMLFRIDKSFLRKNKDIIITREFMEKMGYKKMINLLGHNGVNKTIFLINTADTKDGKIMVREVSIFYEYEM